MRPDTKQKIMDTSICLFKEHGIENVTISQICSATGVTKKTLYYYYPSKESIVMQYYNIFISENPMDLTIKLATMNGYKEKLQYLYFSTIKATSSLGVGMAKSYIRMILDSRTQSSLPCFSLYKNDANDQMGALYIELIKHGQENGEIRNDTPPEVLHWAFLSSLTGALMNWCAKNGEDDEMQLLDTLFMLIFVKTK